MRRTSSFIFQVGWLLLLLSFANATQLNKLVFAQEVPKKTPPRRPLPKPATGSRGFEQAGRDASSRLIAAGATRGPLKPTAPYEGLAYNAQPLFAWTPAPGAASYHFQLRDGADSSSPVAFETDVKEAQLPYPSTAAALIPGRIYSWRVSTAGVMERKLGPSATFFVLAGDDATEIKKALVKANLVSPETPADRLRQAQVFEQYGVWYDAFRVAKELVESDAHNAEAKAFYDSLLKKLQDEVNKAAAQTRSLTLPLWLEVRTFVAAGNEAAARAAISRNAVGARLLYRELLFNAVTSRLYENPTLPFTEQVRKFLVESGEENRALEAKFDQWNKERKLGTGFTATSEGVEQILYLVQAAYIRIRERDPTKEGPDGSPRELTERALELAETNGIEFAVSSCLGTLSFYALRDNRLDEIETPLSRAEEIWKKWNHVIGLAQAPVIRGYASLAAEHWNEAAGFFARAAELAKVMPELRKQRVNALSSQASALRNTDNKEGVREALSVAIDEQQIVLKEVGSPGTELEFAL